MFVDCNNQEAPVEKIPRGDDGDIMRGPLIEKLIDRLQYTRAFRVVKRRRDAEDPHSAVIRKSRDIDAWHVEVLGLLSG